MLVIATLASFAIYFMQQVHIALAAFLIGLFVY